MDKNKWSHETRYNSIVARGDKPETTRITNGKITFQINGCELDDGQLNVFIGLLEQMPNIWVEELDALEFQSSIQERIFTIRDLQQKLPWTIKYSRDFRANPQKHKDFSHAVTHALKALGKLAAIVDDLDHRRASDDLPNLEKYVSDLVVCALRMANTAPDWEGQNHPFDLQESVVNRIENKNGVLLNGGAS